MHLTSPGPQLFRLTEFKRHLSWPWLDPELLVVQHSWQLGHVNHEQFSYLPRIMDSYAWLGIPNGIPASSSCLVICSWGLSICTVPMTACPTMSKRQWVLSDCFRSTSTSKDILWTAKHEHLGYDHQNRPNDNIDRCTIYDRFPCNHQKRYMSMLCFFVGHFPLTIKTATNCSPLSTPQIGC